MNIYFVLFAGLLSVVAAQGGGGGGYSDGGGGEGGHGHAQHQEHYIDYNAHPHYHFHYEVQDPKHHDFKSQWEMRDGDKVKGEYSLVQPDGKKRIVKYTADKHGGFQAEVRYEAGYEQYQHQVQHQKV